MQFVTKVQVIGVCEEKCWIVLEFLEGGDLLNYLVKQRNHRDVDKLIGIAEDVNLWITYSKNNV